MKICFVISNLQCGGAERVCTMIANQISRKVDDFDVTIVTLGDGESYFPLDERVKVESINMQGRSTGRLASANHTLQIILNLRKTIKKYDFDIVISFMTKINILTILATRIMNVKLVITEHTVHDVASKPIKVLRRFLYPMADALTVLVEHDKRYYSRFCNEVRVMVNPNPLSDYSVGKDIIKRRKVILGVGRLDPIKGFDLLIKSFSLISNEFPDWELNIVGDGQERINLEKQIQNNGLEDKIKLFGRKENVEKEYQNAQIFALTSRFEGFGIALVEAMSQGLASLSFNCKAGPEEILSHGIDGILVENGSVESFAKELATLIKNDDLRIKLSRNALLTSTKFHEDQVSNKWIDFIRFVKKIS